YIEAEIGPIDILVNNSGMQFRAPLENFPVDKWDEDVDRTDFRLDIGDGGAAGLRIGDVEGGADGMAMAATNILGGGFR
ncbi:hypothetical protein ACC809_37655, partial [Rhizobium johnstonii]